jgi:ABC-type multidrug transport system fused ATPase/permease subunit
VDGTDIRNYTLNSYRRQVGVVFQDAVLFSGSIRDNIAFGNDAATDEAIERAARTAGADGFIRAFPDGYATLVGERGATLSLGQRQRIAIARAVLRETPILVLDEPTSGLDEHSSWELIRTISALPSSLTLVLTTHDPRLADRADRVAMIEGGRIRETGTPLELQAMGGGYTSLWKVFAGNSR